VVKNGTKTLGRVGTGITRRKGKDEVGKAWGPKKSAIKKAVNWALWV